MNEEKDLPAEGGSAGEKPRDLRDLIKIGMEKSPEELELSMRQVMVEQYEEPSQPVERGPEPPKEEGVPVPPPEEKPPAETEAPKRPPVPPEMETGPQPSGPTEGAPTEPMVSEWRTPIRETLQKAKDEMAREPDISLEELVKQKLREARGLVKPKEQVPQKEQSAQIPPKKGKIEKKRQVFYLTDQQIKKLKKHAIDLGKRYSDVVGDLIDAID